MSEAYTGLARMQVNPLDILNLCEVYGKQTIERIKSKHEDLAYQYARYAFHHAITFCTIDDSYTRNW